MTDWIVDKHWFDESIPWLIPSNGNEFVSSDESTIDSFGDYIFSSIDRFVSRTMKIFVFSLLSPDPFFRFFFKAAPFSTSHFLNFYQYFNEPNSMNFVQEQKIKKTFQQEYRTLQCLGKGGFGQVYAGRRRSDNSPVVVKFLPRDRILNWGTFEGVRRSILIFDHRSFELIFLLFKKRVPYEIEILWRLRGVSGVIKILDHFEETERFIFVMEQIPNSCTLFDFIMESPPLANTELLRHIFREVIRINVTLQMYGVWHRDCKPENILYCKNDRSLCFIDFGAAAPVQTEDFHEFQVGKRLCRKY